MSHLAVRVVDDDDLTAADWMIFEEIETGKATAVVRASASVDPVVVGEVVSAYHALLRSRQAA